jgi:hypothetical protein
MTDLALLLPRANAPIAGTLPPTREFYDFLRALVSLAGEQSSDTESIEQLAARVTALEKAGGITLGTIIGLGSVLANGNLDGLVQIELQGDVIEELPAWHYYGTDSVGDERTFHEFPPNLQSLAGLDSAGFATREFDGSWAMYTIAGGTGGITVNVDGSVFTINGNPYYAAVDDPTGDFHLGPAVATHEQSVALGAGTNTDGTHQVTIGPRDLKIQGNGKGVIMRSSTGAYHAVTVNDSTILFDGAPISGGGGSGNSYMPGGW